MNVVKPTLGQLFIHMLNKWNQTQDVKSNYEQLYLLVVIKLSQEFVYQIFQSQIEHKTEKHTKNKTLKHLIEAVGS